MNLTFVLVCVAVGLGTYLFRYLPTRFGVQGQPQGGFVGPLGKFLSSVGLSAVAALLTAALAPYGAPFARELVSGGLSLDEVRAATAAVVGVAATVVVFSLRREVASATLAGAASYGIVWWLI